MRTYTFDVLVCGAGPTGLFLSYALTRLGARVLLIDRHAGPAAQSRAMAVHARTLEFYNQFGLAKEAIEIGIKTADAHVWVQGRERFAFSLSDMGHEQSPFPFMLTLAQDVHERFLTVKLAELGVETQWNTELIGLSQDQTCVTAQVRGADGNVTSIQVPWLVGCDGAQSLTRKQLGIAFSGGTSEGLFFVADVAIDKPNTDLHVGIDADTLCLMMPVRTTGMQRVIGIVPDALTSKKDLMFADVEAHSTRLLGIKVSGVNWFSNYRVHHRVADQFRAGRCFLAGDAGHIHSPVGRQGMNTGLGDAMNLAWKLASVGKGHADAKILETYEPERIAFARQLITSTDWAFRKLTARGWFARWLRLSVAPSIVRVLTKFKKTKQRIFRTVSQTQISYRGSALSAGTSGVLAGGDRLPWVVEIDNFAPLKSLDWQLHVYGTVTVALRDAAAGARLPLHVFPCGGDAKAKGLEANSAYLIRPDGYIGLVVHGQSAAQLQSYCAQHNLIFQAAAPVGPQE